MLLYPGNSHTTLPHREHQARGNCPSRNLDSKNIWPCSWGFVERNGSMETICKHFQFIGCGSN